MPSLAVGYLTDYAQVHYGDAATKERLNRAAEHDEARYWVGPDGYRLSDRLWEQSKQTRASIESVLREALSQGSSAVETAILLERHLNPDYRPKRDNQGRLIIDGRGGVITLAPWQEAWYSSLLPDRGYGSFPARRLARTEITRAHGNATEKAVAALGDYADMKWALSPSHKDRDECDEIANADRYGLGPGIYPVEHLPRYPAHPMDLCHLRAHITDDDDAIVAAVRAEFGLDDPSFTVLDQVSQAIPKSFDMRAISRVPHQSLGDLFAAIADAAGAVIDAVDRVQSGQSIAQLIGMNLEDVIALHAEFANHPHLLAQIDAGFEAMSRQVDTATKAAARMRALRRKDRERVLRKAAKPRAIRRATVPSSIRDAIAPDGLMQTEWEVLERRTRIPDDLRRALGLPVPVARMSKTKDARIREDHAIDLPIYDDLDHHLQNWEYAGPDPKDDSKWNVLFSANGKQYIAVIGVDKGGSYNLVTFFGSSDPRFHARKITKGMYAKRG